MQSSTGRTKTACLLYPLAMLLVEFSILEMYAEYGYQKEHLGDVFLQVVRERDLFTMLFAFIKPNSTSMHNG